MSGDNTGRIVGTVIGAVAAYFTGGASYVAIGATLGGIAGGALDPAKKVEGPRLDDLKVQGSNYGAGIAVLYGTQRLSPNVIWSTPKLEVANTESQGKGGGVESTNYKYYVWMRLLLCEKPRNGETVSLVKIFQDGKMVWDASSGVPVGSALASAENLFAGLTLYQGDDDQLPDGREESWTGGPGTAPAYRGVVTLFMQAIECPGGRIPQFSFVLTTSSHNDAEVLEFNEFETLDNFTGIIGPSTIAHAAITRQGGNNYTPSFEVGDDYVVQTSTSRTVYESPLNFQDMWAVTGSQAEPASAMSRYPVEEDTIVYEQLLHRTGQTQTLYYGSDDDGRGHIQGFALYDALNDNYALKVTNDNRVVGLPSSYSHNIVGTVIARSYYNDILSTIYYTTPGEMRLYQEIFSEGLFVFLADVSLGTFTAGWSALLFHSADGLFLKVVDDHELSFYVIEGLIPTKRLLSTTTTDNYPANLETTFFSNESYAIIGPFDGDVGGEARYEMVRHAPINIQPVKASDILEDQFQRAGVSAYDLSDVPDEDTVTGYLTAQPATCRAKIDPIMTWFAYFIVDEDGKIKVKRFASITSEATIAYDELGQAPDLSETGEALPLDRAQAIDLPKAVAINYIEPLLDYQVATEPTTRQVVESSEVVVMDLPIAGTSDQANAAGQRILFARWRTQNTRTARVSQKFRTLSPGDGVTVEYPRGVTSLQRITSVNDDGAVLTFALEPGDSELYGQSGVGAVGYDGQQVDPLPPPTRLDILDMPILRDEDSSAGNYSVLTPFSQTSWRGASLFISPDDVNFSAVGSVTRPAVSGFAQTVLGYYGSPMFGSIDHSSTVVVNVGGGELSTVTWDAIFADGSANLAALQSFNQNVDGFPNANVELFQFRVATDLGGGSYELSELRRGLFGTERASAQHGVGDRFVLLTDNGILRVTLATGDIGTDKYYKAVSTGRSPDSVTSIPKETVGYGLKPLSPVNVKLDRTPADGSIAFTWGRRTRFSHNALRSLMPLGETSEVFEVVIYKTSDYQVVANVYRVYTTAFTYTAADMAVDGKTQLGAIPFRIFQISDAIGRGVPYQPGTGIL